MNWLTNGSKTLVACVGIAGAVALACFKVITGQEALGMVGLIWAGYSAVNTWQNGKAPAPPAEQER